MKLLLDMNLSPGWVATLREAGWETVHWSEVGKHDATDAEVMAYAALRAYVVVTHDLDFSSILAATQRQKPSVVQLRADDISPEASSEFVIAALRGVEDQLNTGAIVTISPSRSRVRLLPL